jgi:hypothetical protein
MSFMIARGGIRVKFNRFGVNAGSLLPYLTNYFRALILRSLIERFQCCWLSNDG